MAVRIAAGDPGIIAGALQKESQPASASPLATTARHAPSSVPHPHLEGLEETCDDGVC
jgi:hypothetical protein